MAEGDAKRWFKYGCFGCLGCLGFLAFLAAILVGGAWMRSRSETEENRTLTHATPSTGPSPTPRPPAPPDVAPPTQPGVKAAGKVILELSGAEFQVVPGTPGEPIRVEANYERDSYVLEEHAEEAKDGTWTYRVTFHPVGSPSWLRDALRGMFSSIKPRVKVLLPPDVPMALETRVERGGMEAELGGLRLTTAEIHVAMGGLALKVSEPLPEPMERFEIKTEMGGAELKSIGNASPRVLDASFSMGGLGLDLTGQWRADAEISIRGSMGGADVRLPKDVRIEGVPNRKLETPATGELKVPTLRFTSVGDSIQFK